MFEKFKPMLAKEVDFSLLDFENRSYAGSPKLDGIRATILDGKVYSRTKKLIPNLHVQKLFGNEKYNGLDGELIVGPVTAEDVYRQTNSGVMSIQGEPDVKFFVFDDASEPDVPYHRRALFGCEGKLGPDMEFVPSLPVDSLNAIDTLEEFYLEKGYEGLMLRDINMPYKFGRSTAKQQHLLKVKRFEDSEAYVIGFECLYKNENEATIDALGHTVRSSHQENKTPQDMLGRLLCKDIHSNAVFWVGSGFTHKERTDLWKLQEGLKEHIIKYEYFSVGMKGNIPRHPTFKGFRDPIDL